MNLNFNSSSSSHYTLYCSNEEAELPLSGKGPSSASNFRVNLIPSLDLNQLSHFQSTEVEAKISNMQIDSLPLTYSGDEAIKTYITIEPRLARDNLICTAWTMEYVENLKPLSIGVGDFHAATNTAALGYLNQLLINSANIFVLKRYSELVTDNDNLFLDTAFDNLDIDSEVEISPTDCELLKRYMDISMYTRIKIIQLLKNHLQPNSKADRFTTNYERMSLVQAEETVTLKNSKLLGPTTARQPNIQGLEAETIVKIIDFSIFYGISLVSNERENKRKLKDADEIIRVRLFDYLTTAGKFTHAATSIIPENRLYIEQFMSDQFELLSIGRTVLTLIHNEQERLRTRRSANIFSRPLISIDFDSSGLKCKFIITRDKCIEHMSYEIRFPPIVSYKLGSEKNIYTGKYENIIVGPISLTETITDQKFVNRVVHAKQRLCSSLRIAPKLLCLGTDFLADCNRQTSKEHFLFQNEEVIVFFQMQLKTSNSGSNAVVLSSSEGLHQAFYKVHKARTYLSSLKVCLFDENGVPLNFMRKTIVRFALTFRPAIPSRE